MRGRGQGAAARRGIRGRLVLEDGAAFPGIVFGAAVPAAGEVVFTTGMVGYPEALTDPSYRGQILAFTYPSIGNYGVPAFGSSGNGAVPDARRDGAAGAGSAPGAAAGNGAPLPGRPFESDRVQPAGVICASYSPDFSHHTAAASLGDWLGAHGVPGLTGVDTRALTKRIRARGALLGRIEIDGRPAPDFVDPNARNLVAEVSGAGVRRYGERGGTPVILIDCGKKNNQVRMLVRMGAEVRVVPWDHRLETRRRDYAGVVISNGPGDPRQAAATVATARSLMKAGVPILGICLGHQILALAAGARTYKMKFGHRAHNQPAVDRTTGRCYQTSQNHGYAVDGAGLPDGWGEWFTNANDGTNEGLRHAGGRWRSVQFHPEAAPGPGGTEWILEEFLGAIR